MSAHRYWRLYISASGGSSYIGFAEIELRESAGGSDATGSGTASASQAYGGYPASAAVDNNTATEWAAYPYGAPQWWAYDFGSGVTKDIKEIVITPRTTYYTEAPGTFDLQYSDDGSSWTTKHTFSGISWPNANAQTFGENTIFGVSKAVAYAVLSTEVNVAVSKAVAYVVLYPDADDSPVMLWAF